MRRRVRYRAARSLPFLLRGLPAGWGRGLCAFVGAAGYYAVARDRRLAQRNLGMVHPEWPPWRVRREARRVFEEIGRNAFDFLRYPALGERERDRLVSIRGRAHLDEALAAGRGAVLATGHLGSWEILAATLVREGYPVQALAKPLRERRLDRELTRHRMRMGVRTISSEALPVQALRHLRRGGFLGVLGDQRIRKGGVTVEFLGRPTRMTDGPARLALAAGAPLIPLGIRRLPDHTHRITVLPPVAGADPRTLTRAAAAAVEGLILEAPEQWIWIHPRWEDASPAAAADDLTGARACARR